MLSAPPAHSHSARKQKAPFSPEEDLKLRELVQLHGPQAWTDIAAALPGRNTRQVRERWNLYLSPEIRNDPWTLEEESSLVRIYLTIGPRWAMISQHFPGHAPNSIKNKMKQLLRKGQKSIVAPPRTDHSMVMPESGFILPTQ
jgi:hypothetical protein